MVTLIWDRGIEHYTFGAVVTLPELTIQIGMWHTEYTGYLFKLTIKEFNAEARGESNYVYRDAEGKVITTHFNKITLMVLKLKVSTLISTM